MNKAQNTEHRQKADDILKRMYIVLIRAQRKIDNESYRKILQRAQES